MVETENGRYLRRNRRHIRTTIEPVLEQVSESQVGEEHREEPREGPGQTEVDTCQTKARHIKKSAELDLEG